MPLFEFGSVGSASLPDIVPFLTGKSEDNRHHGTGRIKALR
jgi:hypothetical protein